MDPLVLVVGTLLSLAVRGALLSDYFTTQPRRVGGIVGLILLVLFFTIFFTVRVYRP